MPNISLEGDVGKRWRVSPRSSALRQGATRCRIVECIQVVTSNTRHVPAGPYAGVLPLR